MREVGNQSPYCGQLPALEDIDAAWRESPALPCPPQGVEEGSDQRKEDEAYRTDWEPQHPLWRHFHCFAPFIIESCGETQGKRAGRLGRLYGDRRICICS